MDILKKVMKDLNNPYATVAKDGILCGDIHGYISTGIYALDALISGRIKGGGFPEGKVSALAGLKGCGKSFILLNTIKTYLDGDPERIVLMFESEGAITKKMMIAWGIDISRVAISPVSTVENLRTQVLNVLEGLEKTWQETKEYPKVFICLDSLGMLGTEFELETSRTADNKADMGKRAQLIKSVFRNITLKLSLLRIAMVITNHTYKGMGKYDPSKMSGGQGLEYAASIIIFLFKMADKEPTGKGSIKQLVGNELTFVMHKGRLTIEGSSITLSLDFKKGISKYSGLLDFFVDAGILKKKGAWIAISETDENIAQGKKKFYKGIDNFIGNVLDIDDLSDYVEQRFLYGNYVNIDKGDTDD